MKMFSLLIKTSAIYLVSCRFVARAITTPPDYTPFITSALIPFDTNTDTYPFTSQPRTTVQVSTGVTGATVKTYKPVIDTGSCGFMISAADLPDWNITWAHTFPLGWEFLSSSKIL